MGLDIRKATDGDRPAILNLIAEVFGQNESLRVGQYWDWQWGSNPCLEETGYQGLVVEYEGQLIASMAMVPAGLYIDGILIPDAVWFIDALTHWGRLRSALRSARKKRSLMGFESEFRGPLGQVLNHPLCPRHQLGKHLTRAMQVVAYKAGSVDQPGTGSWARHISYQGLLAGVLGPVLGRPLGALIDLIPRICAPKPIDVRTFEGPFDARFDELFASALKSHRAITRRDAAMLNWRYRQHPDRSYEVLVSESHDRLMGYLVLGCFDRHGQSRAQVLDLLARDDAPAVISGLLVSGVNRLRERGVARLECYTGSSAVQKSLESLGFRKRLDVGRPMRTWVRRIEVPELYVMRGDGDGG